MGYRVKIQKDQRPTNRDKYLTAIADSYTRNGYPLYTYYRPIDMQNESPIESSHSVQLWNEAEKKMEFNASKKKLALKFIEELFATRPSVELDDMIGHVEDAIDDMLFDETKALEKQVAEYESADRERHETFERQAS